MKKNLSKFIIYIVALSLACFTQFAHGDDATNSQIPQFKTSNSSKPAGLAKSAKLHYSKTKGRAVFIFDPRKRMWSIYDTHGKLLRTGRGSGGRNYCPDVHRRCHTPVGTFRVYAREGAGCKSTKFPVGRGGARMPYCSYFHHGFAVHGSYEVRSYNASHGCIRIKPDAARWLQTVLPIGSTVIVRPY